MYLCGLIWTMNLSLCNLVPTHEKCHKYLDGLIRDTLCIQICGGPWLKKTF